MKAIEFKPLEGIVIDNSISIEFGINKLSLIELLGVPTKEFGNELYYDELELHIDVDVNGLVEYIESIMGPYPEKTKISILGINPFETKSDELIKYLTSLNDGRIDNSEADYSYSFLDKSIGVYRSSIVMDVEEMIQEMKDNGDYEHQKEDALFELEKSNFFWTFGIGAKGYYE